VFRRYSCNERKMKLIPIKLLKNSTLLNLKKETDELDTNDYIESRIMTTTLAKQLLAVEDASEMAKLYLHEKGVFEKIVGDIKKETGKRFSFQCGMKVKKTRGTEYIMMEATYDNGAGHYGMVKVDHGEKTAKLYDSMVKAESDFKAPLENFLTSEYTLTVSENAPQPTGGFVAGSLEEFRNPNYSGGVPKKLVEDAYELSQYDELSQHHFCYVESLLAMMNDMGYGDPGPSDPRERLTFVKRVIWGLLHKYVPKEKRRSVQWKYFEENFPYIMDTQSPTGKRMRMVRGYVQVPPAVITLKKLELHNDIDETWSLKRIVDWAA
jgi:hypothetical protein